MDTLENKQLIREFKSVSVKNKKLYILFDVSPAAIHVGDIWVGEKGAEFDAVLVHSISLAMFNTVQRLAIMPMEQLKRMFANNPQILKNGSSLTDRHVMQVLETMKYDGVVEFLDDPASATGDKLVKYVRSPLGSNHLTEMPCGRCPVYDKCGDVGDITPVTCPYFQRWLEIE